MENSFTELKKNVIYAAYENRTEVENLKDWLEQESCGGDACEFSEEIQGILLAFIGVLDEALR